MRALVQPYRFDLVVIGITSFIGGLVEGAFLVLVTRLGLAVTDGSDDIGKVFGIELTTRAGVVVVALGLVLLRLAVGILGTVRATGLTARVRLDLRHRLATAYLDASWGVQQSEPAGHLTQLVTAFANEAVRTVSALGTSLSAALSLVALIGGALWIDPVATLAILVALVVLGSVLAPVRKRIRQRSAAAAAAQLEFSSAVSELGELGLEMQAFGVKGRFGDRIDDLMGEEVRARRAADTIGASLPIIYTSLAYIAVLGGLAVVGLAGQGEVSSLGAVMLVLLRSLTYGQQLQVSSASMMQSLPFLERMDEAIERYDAAKASGGAEVPAAVMPIELRDVSFAYGADTDGHRALSLDGVSTTLAAGETIGVIGPSGAGKSTLVQLLLGVRDPTAGSVLVGGVDLAQVDRTWWTGRVAFVAQDALLFTGTVAENIRFFRDGIDDEAVRRAAGQAHVLAEVEALPDGFGSHLGERASQLSGGQRQRLSIARALAGRPELLILDEPTSALDVRSESLIRQTLTDLRGEATVVIIAHRMSTLDMCDRLLVVEGGKLVASGSPHELREGNEFYRQALELSGLE